MKRAVTLTMPALPEGRAQFLKGLMARLAYYPREQYDVTIERHVERRTLPQNATLWGVVYPQILERGGEQLRGWTDRELHEYFLGEHFGWRTLRLRDDDQFPVHIPVRRSSRLTTKEFAEYLDFIVRRCAEIGVVLTMPGEPAEESPLRSPPDALP